MRISEIVTLVEIRLLFFSFLFNIVGSGSQRLLGVWELEWHILMDSI